MNDISQLLERLESGDLGAEGELLPLVYDELRALARSKLAHEQPGQTLQATALVHEAWLRLAHGRDVDRYWGSRSRFFGAAAEAMRRILIDAARRKLRIKRGGQFQREDVAFDSIIAPEPQQDLLAVNEALERLVLADAQAAELVKLRYFAGLSIPDAADVLGLSQRTAERLWAYARAWLYRELMSDGERPAEHEG